VPYWTWSELTTPFNISLSLRLTILVMQKFRWQRDLKVTVQYLIYILSTKQYDRSNDLQYASLFLYLYFIYGECIDFFRVTNLLQIKLQGLDPICRPKKANYQNNPLFRGVLTIFCFILNFHYPGVTYPWSNLSHWHHNTSPQANSSGCYLPVCGVLQTP